MNSKSFYLHLLNEKKKKEVACWPSCAGSLAFHVSRFGQTDKDTQITDCVRWLICPHLFFWFCFPFRSSSLPVQDPVCQPDGEHRALSHHLPHWNKGGERRPPHHSVSTVPPPIRLTLHHIHAQRSHSLTHAICSWALSTIKKEGTLRRAADTHGNNWGCCMKENYKWGRRSK